jgi:hypothetical protein
MSHVRTQLRVAIRAAIDGIDAIKGYVVFDQSEVEESRASPWAYVELGDEAIAPQAAGPGSSGRLMRRTVPIRIDLYTYGKAEALDQVEEIGALVEARLFQQQSLGGLVRGLTLTAVQPDRRAVSSSTNHLLRLTYVAAYFTSESDPTVAK